MLLEKNAILEDYLNRVKRVWLSSSDTFPDFLSEISYEIKLQNETNLQTILDDFHKKVKCFRRIPFRRKSWKLKMLKLINDVLYNETIIGMHHSMNRQSTDAFQEELKEFLRQVRKFSPELSFEGIGQALRNYIVYAMFKEIHQQQSGFSRAGFGYSMLYPFTDNYIDSKTYSAEEKAQFNQIIRDKIEGKVVHPNSKYQQKTCALLQAIESEYPRETTSAIYPLLLMMLEAQENSIRQQHSSPLLTSEERLDISLYKGGVSVLIDRYLINKDLSEAEVTLYLGLGFFLQLADDLQDIREDSLQGHQTILTLDLSCRQEELLVNKMLHFVHNIMDSYQAENHAFQRFVLANCYQLIYTSVFGSSEFFTQEYLNRIEKYLPVSCSLYETLQKGMSINQDNDNEDKYLKILDTLIMD